VPASACTDLSLEKPVRLEQQLGSKTICLRAIMSTLDGNTCIFACTDALEPAISYWKCQRQTKYRSRAALLQTGKYTSADQQ
jgi:glutamyl-tRNA reductase